MVTRRKRAPSEQEDKPPLSEQEENPTKQQLRDCWEFAALGQFLFIFGSALKLPDTWSIEALEDEILGAIPQKYIPQIKLALLRNVSSHKGLTEDQFEEYTRRQYSAKKPNANPFGDEEQATSFADLPILIRVRILYQLSQWSLIHPERLREKLGDITDKEQQEWRVEPCGFDSQDNAYFLLDDNRLYLQTPMKFPPQITKLPNSSKKGSHRSPKRRRLANGQYEAKPKDQFEASEDRDRLMLDSTEWSCVCATLQQYEELIDKWKKSKDPNEQQMRHYLVKDVIPVIQAAEDEKIKEEAARQRQLAIEAAVANRKRSSRIDAKMARLKEEEEKAEIERKRQEETRAAQEATERLERIGRERESRLAARERRGREGRPLARQERNKESGEDWGSAVQARQSSRRRELEKKKLEIRQAQVANEWMFDCICGVHGINYDDGTPQVACDRCEVWQHVACLNLSSGTENKEFACDRCRRRERAGGLSTADEQSPLPTATSPRLTIKLKLPQAPEENNPIGDQITDPKDVPDLLPLSPSKSPDTNQNRHILNKPTSPSPFASDGIQALPVPEIHDMSAPNGVQTNGSMEFLTPSLGANGVHHPPHKETIKPSLNGHLHQRTTTNGLGGNFENRETVEPKAEVLSETTSIPNTLNQKQTWPSPRNVPIDELVSKNAT